MKEIKLDLFPLIHKLEAVLKKGFSNDALAGNYLSVYKGKGMEFVGFREYSPDDDAMLIDWKASLRAGKPMVRMLQEERNVSVFFLMDVSDSMLFSSHKKLKCEYAAELVGTLSYAMQQVGDNVGLALFNDKVVKMVPPGSSRYQFYSIVQILSEPAFYGGDFDLDYAINYIMNLRFLNRDSIVFIVSDFIGLKEGWETKLKLLGLKYDLTLISVRDPVDNRLPDIGGELQFKDPFSENTMLVNPAQLKLQYEEAAQSQIAKIVVELNKTRSILLKLETDKEFTMEILNFFKMREGR